MKNSMNDTQTSDSLKVTDQNISDELPPVNKDILSKFEISSQIQASVFLLSRWQECFLRNVIGYRWNIEKKKIKFCVWSPKVCFFGAEWPNKMSEAPDSTAPFMGTYQKVSLSFYFNSRFKIIYFFLQNLFFKD